MLIRIVKMSIEPSKTEDFLINFEKNKIRIRHFEGCQFLELYRDKHNTNIFFTYSFWNAETDLNNYRESELFKNIWKKTKLCFNAKPEVWSVDKLTSLQ